MDAPTTPWLIEISFLIYSSISIFGCALAAAPLLAFIYLLFLLAYLSGCFNLRPSQQIMFHSPFSIFNLFIFCTLQLSRFSNAQDAPSTTTTDAATPTTYRPIFTVPSSADTGMYTCSAISASPSLLDSLREMFPRPNDFQSSFLLPFCLGLCFL